MNTTTDSIVVLNTTTGGSVIASKALPTSSLKQSVITTANKILASDTPLDYVERAGIDLHAVYKNLGRIALKAELIAKDRDGEPISLGPDNRSQIMASTLLLELVKHIKDKSVSVSIGIFNDPNVIKDAERVLQLRGRI